MEIKFESEEDYLIVKRCVDILYQKFYRKELEEVADINIIDARDKVINLAYTFLGLEEGTAEWKEKILDAYNSQIPLPVGYKLKDTDAWCAAFITVLAINTEMKHIFPCECSCERMVQCFKNMGRFYGKDSTPFIGDIVFYDWNSDVWADHCGILVTQNTTEKTLYVIEGNKNDRVALVKLRNDGTNTNILGFGRPLYEKVVTSV